MHVDDTKKFSPDCISSHAFPVENVVLVGQPFEVLLLLLPKDRRGDSGPEEPSRIPRYACIPFLTELENFRQF